MLTKNLILNWTARMGFPLKVTSTALQLNSILSNYFNSNDFVNSLATFDKSCFKAQLSIFLACKFEDIHGFLDRIMNNIEDFSKRKYLSKIVELEVEIFEFLDFNFDFVNLYQSALAIKLLIESKTPEKSVQWEYVLLNLNKVLCVADLTSNLMEIVLASFDLEIISDLQLNFDKNLVNEYKIKSEKIRFLSDYEIEQTQINK